VDRVAQRANIKPDDLRGHWIIPDITRRSCHDVMSTRMRATTTIPTGRRNAASAHGHSHGEPTGTPSKNSLPDLNFCACAWRESPPERLPPVRGTDSAPRASRPRTDSYDDPSFSTTQRYRQFLKKKAYPSTRAASSTSTSRAETMEAGGALGAVHLLEGTAGTVDAWVCEIPPGSRTNAEAHFRRAGAVSPARDRPGLAGDQSNMITFEWEKGPYFRRPEHCTATSIPARILRACGDHQRPAADRHVPHTDFIFDND